MLPDQLFCLPDSAQAQLTKDLLDSGSDGEPLAALVLVRSEWLLQAAWPQPFPLQDQSLLEHNSPPILRAEHP